jgi:hypothetical protein
MSRHETVANKSAHKKPEKTTWKSSDREQTTEEMSKLFKKVHFTFSLQMHFSLNFWLKLYSRKFICGIVITSRLVVLTRFFTDV